MFVIRSVSSLALREKPEPVCLLGEIKAPFSRYEGVGGRLLIALSYLSVLFCRKGHLTAAGFLPLGLKATRSRATPLVAQTSRVDQRSRPAEISSRGSLLLGTLHRRLRFWENEDRFYPCLDTCFCRGCGCISKAGHCAGASERWLSAIHKDLGTTETETLSDSCNVPGLHHGEKARRV